MDTWCMILTDSVSVTLIGGDIDVHNYCTFFEVARTGETHLLRGSMVLVGLVRHTCYVALWCW